MTIDRTRRSVTRDQKLLSASRLLGVRGEGGRRHGMLLRFLPKQLGIDQVGSWILSSLWFATEASITWRGDIQ